MHRKIEFITNPANTSGDIPPGLFFPETAARAISARFLDEHRCRLWILEQLHPAGAKCPSCRRSIDDEKKLKRFWSGGRLCCQHCGKFFSAKSETFLAGCNLDFMTIFMLAVLLSLTDDNTFISKFIGLDPKTVRIWRKKFNSLKRIHTES